MSRSNDDRSNSMNPNNSAYEASERNRANQLGDHYDSCDEKKLKDDQDWFLHQENERLMNE